MTNEQFLEKIPKYFEEGSRKAIHLTVKRLVENDPVEGNAEFDAAKQPDYDVSRKAQSVKVETNSQRIYPVLIRARAHSKKCSTVVDSDSLDKFWQDYSAVVKSSMKGLVKKKKKRTKVAGVKSKASKKHRK